MTEPKPLPLRNLNTPIYAVVQRDNGEWSVAARIMQVVFNELQAESIATRLKQDHPHQHYGVFKLRSEARTVNKPVEIVRMESD